ncbi:helix-turn-helix transcriptional regulator [Streptomyces sp. NPDC051211]|uniref:helix-turn-helix domain-containing protein n=1 Tax=Streptomyces sp. NPDC051211 TaxID=3154643 RepID=UPI00344D5106
MSESASVLPTHGRGEEEALAALKRQLRRLRVERGLSMAGLALRASLGRTTASQALNGDTVPSEPTLVSLAKALRTPAEPLLELRASAVARAVAVEGVEGAEGATCESRPRETRFTYEYLGQRPTGLLRVLHDKLRSSPVVRLRIRTVDIFQSWAVEDAELPARAVQYADECVEAMDVIHDADGAAEGLLLLAVLTELSELVFEQGKAQEDVSYHIVGNAMAFLDVVAVDSLEFLNVRSTLGRELLGGKFPWSALDDIRDVLREQYFSPDA